MKTIQLKAAKRDAFGKKGSKATRRNAHVPCVLYGGGDTIHFSIDEKEMRPLIYSPNSYIVEFDIEGTKETGVIRQAQFHPVREQVLHIDFTRVIPGKPVTIEVPVRLTGNSTGVKLGGKLALSKRKIFVSALVENLPDELVIDVTNLELGKSIFVGDLSFENVTMLTPASTAVCAVNMTRAARGAQAAAAEK
ncbi:MAG: 50S ribosomal protein L25/general stress protein Ctc [Rikenellaceae bacterium]|jgi:large subunit ribosomal protein L25|nr:50S ribosomal protein L25/general stress protein Ctc [Rikenellaceae bacterium]